MNTVHQYLNVTFNFFNIRLNYQLQFGNESTLTPEKPDLRERRKLSLF